MDAKTTYTIKSDSNIGKFMSYRIFLQITHIVFFCIIPLVLPSSQYKIFMLELTVCTLFHRLRLEDVE